MLWYVTPCVYGCLIDLFEMVVAYRSTYLTILHLAQDNTALWLGGPRCYDLQAHWAREDPAASFRASFHHTLWRDIYRLFLPPITYSVVLPVFTTLPRPIT